MTSRPLPLLLVALLLLSSLAPLASAGEEWKKETGSAITAVATDERGDLIFVGTQDGYIKVYDSTGALLSTWYEGGNCLDIATNQDGSRLTAIYFMGDHVRGRYYIVSPNGVITGGPMYLLWESTRTTSMDRAGRTAIHSSTSWAKVISFTDAGLIHTEVSLMYQISDLAGDGSWMVFGSGSNLYCYSFPNTFWDIHRNNRIRHTITGSSSGAVTNWPYEITVIRGSGTNSGNTVYLPTCQADFGDVRFTAADGVTELEYCLKSVSGNTATFAVKVPSIPQAPGTTSIYIYWEVIPGTVAATTTSNPDARWVLYDDFEDGVINTSLWTVTNTSGATATEAGGYMELISTAEGQEAVITGKTSYKIPVHVNMTVSFPATSLHNTLFRVRTFDFPETFTTEHTSGDGTLDLKVQGGGSSSLVLADNIKIDPPQTFEAWFVPGENMTIKYGTDYNGSVPFGSSSLRVVVAAFAKGHIRIHDISVEPSSPNPFGGSWGSPETQVALLDTKTLDGTIIDIDAPETGDWVAVSTTTKTYIIEITDSGFGTVYSADRTGTPYDLAIANNGANVIEGRGILADIFRFDGVQTGTYTAGGPVRTVAIAQKNGLYAAAGSDDGKYYVFSKDESSSWYLLHASDSEEPVTAIAMSWRGEIAVIGRADGSVVLYTTTDAPPPDSQMTVYTIKDGQPYIGKPVSVSTADISDPDKWTPLYTNLRTDSDGKIVISTHTGHYYQININNGEKIVVIQASSATSIHSVVFRSPLIYEKYSYDVQYNASSQAIEMTYTDNEGPATVSWSIVRTDTYSEVYSHTTSGATTATTTYPVSEPDISYKVNVKVQRSSGESIQNMWFVTPQNASPIALPFWDENIQNAVFIIFLMILGGVFYYSTGAKGALIVALVAALFRYFSWITVPWFWIIAAAVFAFLANIAEGA